MKKLLCLIGFMMMAMEGWCVIALRNPVGKVTQSGTTCVVVITAETAGDLLVAGAAATSAPTGVADNAGTVNTFTHDTLADGSASGISTTLWYKPNCNSGGTSVTFSGMTNGGNGDCFVWEFSGAATATPIDVRNHLNSLTSANPENGATVTPTDSGDVCVDIFGTLSGAISGMTGVYTYNGGAGNGQGAGFVIPGNTSLQTPTYTGDGVGSAACSSTLAFCKAGGCSAAAGGANKAWRYNKDE